MEWISIVVLVMKKNEKLRICIYFHHLNTSTTKDEYPMSVADLLVHATSRHEILSFMDGYSRYNKIFIAKEDSSQDGLQMSKGFRNVCLGGDAF